MDDEEDAEFWEVLGGSAADILPAHPDDKEIPAEFVKKIFRLSDSTGALSFTEVERGKISKSSLDSGDVFIVDIGKCHPRKIDTQG